MTRPEFSDPVQRIMVPIDVDELSQARQLAERLQGLGLTFKIGNQLGTYEGWRAAVDFAHEYDAQIFCDTKFKDIPNTVEQSCRAITRHQPDFFNIMADNNPEALRAAVRGRDSAVTAFKLAKRPILLGVTVLTSINQQEAREIYGGLPSEKVLQFARNAAEAGLDGVVCSPEEAQLLRNDAATKDLLLVTPGIRPMWGVANDQSRVLTPSQAIKNGSDYLVIGRPITRPPQEIGSPLEAALRIIEEIQNI